MALLRLQRRQPVWLCPPPAPGGTWVAGPLRAAAHWPQTMHNELPGHPGGGWRGGCCEGSLSRGSRGGGRSAAHTSMRSLSNPGRQPAPPNRNQKRRHRAGVRWGEGAPPADRRRWRGQGWKPLPTEARSVSLRPEVAGLHAWVGGPRMQTAGALELTSPGPGSRLRAARGGLCSLPVLG